MGQEDLASFLGVTVQQIQKYETGFSRIGAGRLQQIATKLSVSVSSLFNTEVGTDKPKIVQQAMADATLAADCAELNRAFQRISDPGTRQKLVALAVAVSRDDEASGV
jgi:transcriptional regulator with XRE-family HTH domain